MNTRIYSLLLKNWKHHYSFRQFILHIAKPFKTNKQPISYIMIVKIKGMKLKSEGFFLYKTEEINQ